MKEKLDTDIFCLEGYNTGYNENIDGERLHAILEKIHSTDYGHLSITVPALNPEKTHEYYAKLEVPVRNHCIVPWCQCNINYNGDVTFCADYNEYVLGNITQQKFSDIYNGERANKFRQAIDSCEGGIFPGCLRCYQNMLFGKKIKGF
jgi:MoaA/NifB/PqqE/SkfB family radical SAM enzyme